MKPEELFKMINDLKLIMNADDTITEEEKIILDSVTTNVDVFNSAYKKAMEDNVITDGEFLELQDLWHKIYDDSYTEAMSDKNLSDDEAAMVFKIFDVLHRRE